MQVNIAAMANWTRGGSKRDTPAVTEAASSSCAPAAAQAANIANAVATKTFTTDASLTQMPSADMRVTATECSASDANSTSGRSAGIILRELETVQGQLIVQWEREVTAAATTTCAVFQRQDMMDPVRAELSYSPQATPDTEAHSLRVALESASAEVTRLHAELAARANAEQAQLRQGAADIAGMAAAIRSVHECGNLRLAAAEAASVALQARHDIALAGVRADIEARIAVKAASEQTARARQAASICRILVRFHDELQTARAMANTAAQMHAASMAEATATLRELDGRAHASSTTVRSLREENAVLLLALRDLRAAAAIAPVSLDPVRADASVPRATGPPPACTSASSAELAVVESETTPQHGAPLSRLPAQGGEATTPATVVTLRTTPAVSVRCLRATPVTLHAPATTIAQAGDNSDDKYADMPSRFPVNDATTPSRARAAIRRVAAAPTQAPTSTLEGVHARDAKLGVELRGSLVDDVDSDDDSDSLPHLIPCRPLTEPETALVARAQLLKLEMGFTELHWQCACAAVAGTLKGQCL